ncbi:MAG: exo-alpha-sialidase [Planctomycetota bacterium]
MDIAERLRKIASKLVDQQSAERLIAPQHPSTGHWFGGGNIVCDDQGVFWLVGRYRNQGDSRTGLGAGQRGLELAIFRSSDGGQSFQKFESWTKSELNVGDREVLSIEGSALHLTADGLELYVSTEKSGISYPSGLESFLKPGTGVWTIDRIVADSFSELKGGPIKTVLETQDPRFIHMKDPFLGTHRGIPCLMFCTHPYCWTSSNTGFVPLQPSPVDWTKTELDFFPRGFTWDVAITRGTALVSLPSVGVLKDREVKLLFYDGGECVRNLDEHQSAVKRPRGYSCEEIGGVASIENDDLYQLQRLSDIEPLLISPHGSGCSRYVDVCVTDDQYLVTWQQAQADGSQPLMINRVSRDEIEALLQ